MSTGLLIPMSAEVIESLLAQAAALARMGRDLVHQAELIRNRAEILRYELEASKGGRS
jgi:hypothetical protein